MPRTRIDNLLLERGLVESRAKAQSLIMAGQVRADGQVVLKSSTLVEPGVRLELKEKPRFVSRGGEKLEAAFEKFGIDVAGTVCADVGASTGGFTDCLLQRGAARVYAIDVGKGVLHWKLRKDARVVVMEQTNARYVDSLPEKIDLAVVDASFISLKILLPVIMNWLKTGGQIICLVKPQFEAGRKEATRGAGVIRDRQIHRRILFELISFASQKEFRINGLIRSPILGPKGNEEYLLCLSQGVSGNPRISELIDQALA